MFDPYVYLQEQVDGLSSERVWLFILLMVVMVVGFAVTGRKGRKK